MMREFGSCKTVRLGFCLSVLSGYQHKIIGYLAMDIWFYIKEYSSIDCVYYPMVFAIDYHKNCVQLNVVTQMFTTMTYELLH